MGYLTSDTIPTTSICYSVRLPNTSLIVAAFIGAVLQLTQAYNWEVFGEQTPEDMALAFETVYQNMAVLPGRACMIGQVIALATATLPPGVLLCDGTQYLRTAYPDLYATLHATYIDDADNFTVPDLRSQFVYGANSFAQMNNTGGSATETLTSAQVPAHTHTYNAPVPGAILVGVGAPVPANIATILSVTSASGSGGSHNNLPPYTKLAYGIVAE